MGLLADLWYLHREAILRIAGVCMLIAAGVVVIAGARGSADGAYEAGATAGVVFRNLAVPLVVAAVAGYLVRRWYWYDESASWRELTPESVAIAGALSLALAVIGGGAASESTDSELIETAITRGFMTGDPANCDEVYTLEFVEQTHLGTGVVAMADCREDEAEPNPRGTDPDGVEITGLQINGDRATARVTVLGGALNQAKIELGVVTEEGTWKLDRMRDVDLDRPAYDRAFAAAVRREGMSRDEARCVVDQFHRDFRMAELERSAVSGVQMPDPEWSVGCFATSTLRQQLLDRSREAMGAHDAPAPVVDCLLGELRDLPPARIRAIAEDRDGEGEAAMRDLTAACLAAAESSSPA